MKKDCKAEIPSMRGSIQPDNWVLMRQSKSEADLKENYNDF